MALLGLSIPMSPVQLLRYGLLIERRVEKKRCLSGITDLDVMKAAGVAAKERLLQNEQDWFPHVAFPDLDQVEFFGFQWLTSFHGYSDTLHTMTKDIASPYLKGNPHSS